ncbi:hypothetical protein HYH03_008903 [Edaphochlamys debaryana]|uniref:Uncharacterized protein n=1 Tax=Edaphochlamys debaryana TaxID=47281 RepID=A0A835XX58_9CHLO|nr:hypothetical protein HYH03_008903 [Edaphochlamys debaryana]|eukprot:KAG2492737.1 hypothetical protein HYH03_008903 [Edaphochlamys debaryana]
MANEQQTDHGATEETKTLQLELHTNEAVWMQQIGHLKDWCGDTRAVRLGVPSRVPTQLAAESIRLLFLFNSLQSLELVLPTHSRIEQPTLVACAELLNLTSLRVTGGHIPFSGIDLSVLTSLRRLSELAVRPHSDEGMDGMDDDGLSGAARLTNLTSLSLRASESVTDEGVKALGALTGLTRLSLVPLGLCVTREGLAALAARLPRLARLDVGLHEARQVASVKGFISDDDARDTAAQASPPQLGLVLNSPEASASGFFSTLTLLLRPCLTSLRLATLEATDGAFLLALGTLTALTELKMGVSLPEGGRPFACGLGALSSLSRLETLEFAVTQDLALPLSVKLVSMLALSWPNLRSLSLSAMAKPEVVPEALGLLDNFRKLTSLSLFAPLDYNCDDEMEALVLPIVPRYLPRGLTALVLEAAELKEPDGPPSRTPSASEAHPPALAERHSAGHSLPPVLSRLTQLELNSCATNDDVFSAVLSGATGLRHLELTDVSGVSDESLGGLKGLTRLEHLVVRCATHVGAGPSPAALAATGSGPGPAGTKSGPGSARPSTDMGTGAPGSGLPRITHASLSVLRFASALRHLEWSLPEPLDAAALDKVALPIICGLNGLQHLSLDVAPELRTMSMPGYFRAGSMSGSGAGAGSAGGARRSGPGTGSVASEEGEGEDEEMEAAEGSAGGAGAAAAGAGLRQKRRRELTWRERLAKALPLCSVSERPGIVLYDLWNDRTVHIVGKE